MTPQWAADEMKCGYRFTVVMVGSQHDPHNPKLAVVESGDDMSTDA